MYYFPSEFLKNFYLTQNHWIYRRWQFSSIKHNVSENVSVSEEWRLLGCYAVWLL
jgi:hypothetical protein